jgi:hypothetical protein
MDELQHFDVVVVGAGPAGRQPVQSTLEGP